MLSSPIPLIMMCMYIVIVLILSYRASFSKKVKALKKNQTFEEYYTAGKSMNGVVVALITIVTFYSGTTFTGRVGFFYTYGVVGLNTVFTCAMVGVIMFFLSEKIWPLSKKYRLSTLSDLMELRYQSKGLKALMSLTIVGFNIIWLITEIQTLGFVMNIATGGNVSTTVGSAIAFAVIISYVMTGGVRSVAAVDSFSAIIMLGGSLIAICYVVAVVFGGNVGEMIQLGATANEQLMTINSGNAQSMPYWVSGILLSTVVMLAYPSNYMGICLAKNVKAVKKSAIATSLSGPWLMIYGFIALAVLGAETQGFVVSEAQTSFLELLSYTGNAFMLGLVVTFILAASLGTLDSTLISLSGLLSNDVVTNALRIRAKEPCIGELGDDASVIAERVNKNAKKEIFRTRIIVLILGCIGFGFSLTNLPMLVILTNYATGGICQTIPAVIGGLYWKKGTTQGAVASVSSGVGSFLLMDYLVGVFNIETGGLQLGIPAVGIATIVYVIVSLCTYKKYYEKHLYAQGIYDDFFIKGRAEAYIASQTD